MPTKSFSRTDRLGTQLKQELAGLTQQVTRNAGLGLVSITAVEVTRDLSQAKVFFSVLSTDPEHEPRARELLQSYAAEWRGSLGRLLHVRTIPVLHFVADHSMDQAASMSALIKSARDKDNQLAVQNHIEN